LIPAHDYPDYPITQHFEEANEFIDINRKSGKSVYVFCAAGVSRSPTFVIAYLMKTMKMTVDDAINLVKSRRKMIEPNSGFVDQLKEYEAALLRL